MSEWIRVKDRLPEQNGSYLTYVMDNGTSSTQHVQTFSLKPRKLQGIYGESFTHWQITQWDDHITTHWMSLPKPPSEP